MKESLTFVTTWHPAYLFKDMARGARSFLLHARKAVEIALGKEPDKLPEILIDPPEPKARKIFRSWTEGFAIDVETPALKEFRLLSVAVCGSPDLVMVWNCQKPSKLGPLREMLESKVRKVVQNGDFDIGILEACGYKLDRGSFWDTMIEAQIRHPDEPVNLSFLASLVTDIEAWKWRRESDLLTYNGIDAWVDWLIYLANQQEEEDE